MKHIHMLSVVLLSGIPRPQLMTDIWKAFCTEVQIHVPQEFGRL